MPFPNPITLQKNRRYAIFLGYVYFTRSGGCPLAGWKMSSTAVPPLGIDQPFLCVRDTDMRFHTSWDWWMAAWKHWKSLLPLFMDQDYPQEDHIAAGLHLYNGTLDQAYEALYVCIAWYFRQQASTKS